MEMTQDRIVEARELETCRSWACWRELRRRVLVRWPERHRQRRQLESLSDDQLADIGVSRQSAAREAKRWFWD